MATNGVNVIQAGLACCGVESSAVDLVNKSGVQVLANGESANILVVAGTVTNALAEKVEQAYQSLADPKIVIAYGVCAITGGPYWDSYSVIPGASALIPVAINVPGCPPSPEDLAQAIKQAQELVDAHA